MKKEYLEAIIIIECRRSRNERIKITKKIKSLYAQKNYPIFVLKRNRKMVVIVKKGMNKKKFNEELLKIKHTKKLDTKQHLGKVKWGEDALEYQKKLRDEWD